MMNCMLFFDAIIWIIEHNQWLDRAEASELQMKREEFIYLKILDFLGSDKRASDQIQWLQ